MKKLFLLLSACLILLFSACNNPQTQKEEVEEIIETTKLKIEFLESKIERKKDVPFSDAVRMGDLLFLAGQIGFNNDSLKLAPGGIKAETKQALENIKDVLEANGSDMEHVAKCTVILSDINDFAAFNEVYRQYFPKNKPARTTFGANLVLEAKIEIEAIAAIK